MEENFKKEEVEKFEEVRQLENDNIDDEYYRGMINLALWYDANGQRIQIPPDV